MDAIYLKKWSLPPEVVTVSNVCLAGVMDHGIKHEKRDCYDPNYDADVNAFDVEKFSGYEFTQVQKHSSQKILETINLFKKKEVSQELENIDNALPNTEIEISGRLLSGKVHIVMWLGYFVPPFPPWQRYCVPSWHVACHPIPDIVKGKPKQIVTNYFLVKKRSQKYYV